MRKIPNNIKSLLKEIKDSFSKQLGKNLVGIYIHGSLAMSSFNINSSDIDFLAVVKRPLTLEEKKRLIDLILKLTTKAPAGDLDYSILTLAQAKNFQYPTPYELHYGKDWKEKYIHKEVDFDKQKYDYDLAAHFVIAKNRGYTLVGEPIDKIFPDIPRNYYIDSIVKDSDWSFNNIQNGPNVGLCRVPVYGVLNLCRVLAYLENDLITSKSEGGAWALQHLSKKYKQIIKEALREYGVSGSSKKVDAGLLKQFVHYGRDKVKKFISSTRRVKLT